MTDETPGTSLTDDRFAQHIWKIAYDAMRREGATEDHAMAWADVLRIEVEKRARERRERVDPDLANWPHREDGYGKCETCHPNTPENDHPDGGCNALGEPWPCAAERLRLKEHTDD